MEVAEGIRAMTPFIMNRRTWLARRRGHAASIALEALDQPVRLGAVEIGLGKASASGSDAVLNGLIGDNPHSPAQLTHDLLSRLA